ncbi:MAG TPA: AbrB/MazE/SpoVT family DNA-binding domain-containing protein [Candidatus Binatia bacterium]|nr:AbrB/MazE/SpoVT family DNA-binding domain-containing protein [Candidatus Binatia bacterium]
MYAKIGERGQVTIPKRLRDRLGLRPGMEIEFEEEGGRLVGTKVVRDRLDGLVGIVHLPGGTDAVVDELRGPRPTGPSRAGE